MARESVLREIEEESFSEIKSFVNAKESLSPAVGKESRSPSKLSGSEFTNIIVENRDHGMRLAWSMLNRWRIRIPEDDIISVVGASLVEAAHKFDPGRNVNFKTFFFYHLRGMLIKEVTQILNERKASTLSSDDPVGHRLEYQTFSENWPFRLIERTTPEQIFARRQFERSFRAICKNLDNLEREVLIRHLVDDDPLNKIAKDLKYCRCHISRVKSRALKRLRQLLPEDLNESPISVRKFRNSLSSPKASSGYKGGRGRRKRI